MHPTIFQWDQKKFIIFNLLALLLWFTWVCAPFSEVWMVLDRSAFYLFNSFLESEHVWQMFWALANTHWFDNISMLLLAILVFWPGGMLPREHYKRLVIGLFASLFAAYFLKYIWGHALSLQRVSPSVILSPVILLPDVVPELGKIKYSSKNCFPGDHAAVIYTWLVFMLIYAKPNWRYLAIGVAGLLSLPRLVVGAHWLSDDLVGGVCIALISVTWVCYLPFERILKIFTGSELLLGNK